MKDLKRVAILLFFVLVKGYSLVVAQTPINGDDIGRVEPKDEMVYHVVENKPQYPGGESKLTQFLNREFHFPNDTSVQLLTGKVFVQFIIMKDGSIDNKSIQIIRGVHTLLDNEAIRLVKLMPKWKPGFQGGKPVKCKFIFPLNFLPSHTIQYEPF
jgi:periplasmic protein TonB